MDAKDSLASAIARFRAIASELGHFMADSEQAFLATGASLQHLESEANRVLTESSRDTQMGTGDSDPAERLRRGVGELDLHLERSKQETERGLRALTAVLSGIAKLSRLDGDFQLIVATLHALASTTHLENSRQITSKDGFDSVVSDLRRMALQIKPKFGEVLAQSRDVRTTAESALAKAQTFLARHGRDVRSFRQETQKQLAAMSGACRISQRLADSSTASMNDVRSNVGQVLQSLQVQDLARQMLEHVVQDLDEFVDSAAAVVDADAPLPELRSWLAELALVSRLQSAQLGNASDRLVRGLSQIDSSLQSMVSTLSLLAKESANISGKTVGTSVFTQLERGIRVTTETLHAHDAQADTMMRALAKVCETAAGVEKLVDEVAWLGKDARFIGLNAMVKAVRVGQAGATLTVLAREIQTVSDQIQDFTAAATTIMESVGEEARVLVTAQGQSTTKRSGEDVAAGLERLMGELATYQASLATAVEVLLSGSDALRREVSATGKELHELVERAKRLRLLSYELANLHNLALLDARGAAPPAGRSHGENQRHTMEEERQVQRLALGGAATKPDERSDQSTDVHSPEGSIEFF
jgi:hypothetical protein